MRQSDLILAVNQVCAERGLDPQMVLKAIEQALVIAYRKKFGAAQNVEARIDPKTGDIRILARMEVVEKVRDRRLQISLEEARRYKPDVQVGETIVIEATPKDFGRIAAQTAKQVMLQRIREAERETAYQELLKVEHEVVQGLIQRVDRKTGEVFVNLGRAEGILPREEQIPRERYRRQDRMYFYVLRVEKTPRGPYAILSRTHPHFVRRLLEREVPEIRTGAVEIKAIAREAGSRTKIAVAAVQPGVDPVGSCVGVRGTRIQAVVNALGGEKIDVIEWDKDPQKFIANALSPARVIDVLLIETKQEKRALVIVPDDQLSLAIGREGQNARLAAKLTGWHIDIKSESEARDAGLDAAARDRLRQAYAAREVDILAQAEAILREGKLDELKHMLEGEGAPQTAEAPAAVPTGDGPPETASGTAAEAQEVDTPATSGEPTTPEEEDYVDTDYLDELALQQIMSEEESEADSTGREP